MINRPYRRIVILTEQHYVDHLSQNYESEVLYLLWDNTHLDEASISIPEYIDAHVAELRDQIVTELHEFSQVTVGKKKLFQYFNYDNDFSFWQMSLLYEKSHYKSDVFFNLLKIYVVERFIHQGVESIQVEGDLSKNVIRALKLVAAKHNTIICLRKSFWSGLVINVSMRSLFSRLPHIFQGLIWFFYYIYQRRPWFFQATSSHDPTDSIETVTIFSYFQFDMSEAKRGCFKSSYWADLPNTILKMGKRIRWCLFYVKSGSLSIKDALYTINAFKNQKNNQEFFFHDQEITVRLCVLVFYRYLYIIVQYVYFRIKLFVHQSRIRKNPIYRLMNNEIKQSFLGLTSVENCFYFYIYRSVAAKCNRDQIGLFLLENQAWEKALTYHWKQKNPHPIIGFAHSTVRDYDLRYFGFRYELHASNITFGPDAIAVAGKDAQNKLIESGLQSMYLIPVEAVRYIDLPSKNYYLPLPNCTQKNALLFFLEYSPHEMVFQLGFMSRFFSLYPLYKQYKILIKPHPFNINIESSLNMYLSGVDFVVTHKKVSLLMDDVDMAISGQSSSVAIDLAIAIQPFAIIRDPRCMNMSPLLAHKNLFVKTPEDLFFAIQHVADCRDYLKDNFSTETGFYYTDPSLPKWKKLLVSLC